MKIISILGSKGGCGKTTLSHMLCYGLGLLGHRAAFVMTDIGREPPAQGKRPYVHADARNAEARQKIISALKAREGWIGVIDGGANRQSVDTEVCRLSDLVLLPFRDSQEDLRVVCRDLEQMPSALALPSQWPTNPWQYKASVRLLESMPEHLRHRVLAPVFAISASKLLLQDQPAERLPSSLNNACRSVARYFIGILEHGPDAVPAEQTALAATRRIERIVKAREQKNTPAGMHAA